MGVHGQSVHGIKQEDVLNGDVSIQILDYVCYKLKLQYPGSNGLLPLSFLYSLEMARQNSP